MWRRASLPRAILPDRMSADDDCERIPIRSSARMTRVAAGAAATPDALRALAPSWMDTSLPATLASVLRDAGQLDLSSIPKLEDQDVWFVVPLPKLSGPGARVLVLEGLATVTDVFVNGALVLHSTSALTRHEIDVGDVLRGDAAGDGELALCFRALDAHLGLKHPRPRWKTRLVEHQNLRFVRTSLLGRTTGFCPAVPAVGPYLPIALERRQLHARVLQLNAVCAGTLGVVRVRVALEVVGGAVIEHVWCEVGESSERLMPTSDSTFEGECSVPDVARWWPHTHGTPHRYPVTLVVVRQEHAHRIALGQVGFRTVERDEGSGFGLRINDVPVFVRGAVWTCEDVVAQNASEDSIRSTLVLARDAGMNMIRVGGTSGYAPEAFHEIADELGILVFQDFAFANMDYPVADEAFRTSVEAEVAQVLSRIAWRPSTAVFCGNSEVEQQAAMLGLPREVWTSTLFSELIPSLVAARAPATPYIASSPTGGTMPFHTNEGVGHYYGVGAYLRPMSDARTTHVAFASECLAFANVPAQATIDAFMRDLEAPVHHPRWKERVPRDRGASWDFEDVRDHYLELLFGISARTLRYEDRDRYLALSRVVTGECMARVFAEWRRAGSTCRGGLIFFLKDFWPGAGFGIIDALGRPKAALRIAARVLAPCAILAIDEGVNGLFAHVTNDGPEPLTATLGARLVRDGEIEVARAEAEVRVPEHGVVPVHVDALFGGFVDTTYAYRFGPPQHDLVELTLHQGEHVIARAHHLPLGLARPVEHDLGLEAEFVDDHAAVVVRTRRLALFVALELEGLVAEDDFFHVVPGDPRRIALRRVESPRPPRGSAHPINQREATRIR